MQNKPYLKKNKNMSFPNRGEGSPTSEKFPNFPVFFSLGTSLAKSKHLHKLFGPFFPFAAL